MDAIERAVFDKIYSAGGYAIIEAAELAEELSARRSTAGQDGADAKLSEADVDSAVKALREQGYIDLKYARGGTYCAAAIRVPSAEEPEEGARRAEGTATVIEVSRKTDIKSAVMCALFALAGGALGSAIVCAIAATV